MLAVKMLTKPAANVYEAIKMHDVGAVAAFIEELEAGENWCHLMHHSVETSTQDVVRLVAARAPPKALGFALSRMVDSNKIEKIKWLLQCGADPNGGYVGREAYVYLPLLFARTTQMAHFLVEQQADVNLRNHKGQSLLDIAVGCSNITMAKFLMQRGADDRTGRAVNTACAKKNVNALQLLLANGCSAAAVTNLGTVCSMPGDVAILRLLLEGKADANKFSGDSPLATALFARNQDSMRLLLAAGASLLEISVVSAAMQCKGTVAAFHCMQLLEAKGFSWRRVDPNMKVASGTAPLLQRAYMSNNVVAFGHLLESGAKIEGDFNYLEACLNERKLQLFQLLVHAGADLSILQTNNLNEQRVTDLALVIAKVGEELVSLPPFTRLACGFLIGRLKLQLPNATVTEVERAIESMKSYQPLRHPWGNKLTWLEQGRVWTHEASRSHEIRSLFPRAHRRRVLYLLHHFRCHSQQRDKPFLFSITRELLDRIVADIPRETPFTLWRLPVRQQHKAL